MIAHMKLSLKFNVYLFIVLSVCLGCSEDKSKEAATDFCSQIHRNEAITLSDELKDVAELMKTKTGVYVLEDGSGSLVARAWLCEYAEKTIDIQYFIFIF